MAIVENNAVKMEWEKSGWLQAKNGSFIFGSVTYPSQTKGEVTVFFTPDTAFLWISDAGTDAEDMWNASELKSWCKESLDGSFPHCYSEYVPVIASGDETADDHTLELYGIAEHKADIEARMADLEFYRGSKMINM